MAAPGPVVVGRHLPAGSGAALLLTLALLAASCGGSNPGLTDAERQDLADTCASLSAAGASAYPDGACARIVDTIAEDAKALGCSYETAQRLLVVALRADRAAVRRIERTC